MDCSGLCARGCLQVLTLNSLDVVTEPFQSELAHGVKLRSPVSLRNCTQVTLEVSVHPVSLPRLHRSAQRANREAAKATAAVMPSFLDTLDFDQLQPGMQGVEDIYENQRWASFLRGRNCCSWVVLIRMRG